MERRPTGGGLKFVAVSLGSIWPLQMGISNFLHDSRSRFHWDRKFEEGSVARFSAGWMVSMESKESCR